MDVSMPGTSAPSTAGSSSALADLLGIVATISSDHDTRDLLSGVVASACELTGALSGTLTVLGASTPGAPVDSAGRSLVDFISHGFIPDDLTEVDDTVGPAPGTEPGPGRPQLTIPVTVDDQVFGNLCLTDKRSPGGEDTGLTFTEEDGAQVSALAAIASLILGNLRSQHANERRRRWLDMFGQVADVLAPPVVMAEALENVTAAVMMASDAESAAVFQMEPGGDVASPSVSGSEEIWDLADPELVAALAAVGEDGQVRDVKLTGGQAALLAPLKLALSLPGVLAVAHPLERQTFFEEERDLLCSLAEHVALNLDRAQAVADRQMLSVMADRDRIARDLHDVVIQRLFATGLGMQSLRSATKELPELRSRVDQVASDLDQTIRDIRRTIFDLKEPARTSLRSELGDLVRECIPLLGFAPSVHLIGQVDLAIDPGVHQRLTAVIRETLTNVAKHAQAGSVVVELSVATDAVRLSVLDNGRGLPENPKLAGLRNARRWAAMLGGTLSLDTPTGGGTQVVWEVPLPT